MVRPPSSRGARSWVRTIPSIGLCMALVSAVVTAGPAAAAPSEPSPSARPTQPAPSRNDAFGIGPASATKIDGRPYLSYLASPGTHLTDHVALVNLSAGRLTIQTYAVDATNGTDGALGFAAHAAQRKDAGAWITVVTPHGSPLVTLAPRQILIVPVDVVVPSNAEPGDHVAGIIASITSQVLNKQGRKVNFEQRVALRTFLRISGTLTPQLSVSGLSVSYPGQVNPFSTGTATVRYTVHNNGNVRLSAGQRVTVSGLFGAESASVPSLPILFPGGEASFVVHVRNVYPQLRMTARVTLKPITVLGDVDPSLPSQFVATTSFWAPPWTLLALIALIVVATTFVLVRRRRRSAGPAAGHRRRKAPETKRSARTVGEELPA